MEIVIGCSGSTGSSLLKTILNRHSLIFAGPEAALFSFPQIYEQWDKYQSQALKGLKHPGWQMKSGMDLLQPDFGWGAGLLPLIQSCTSFEEFVGLFFKKPLQQFQKKIWVEKTPANAIGLQAFLNSFPDGKAIQTVRNPYDTMASLVARGLSPYQAAAYYIFHTAAAAACREEERYYEIRYENLVTQPYDTLKKLCAFLKIPFEPEIIIARHEQRAEPTSMPGWQHEETGTVQSTSIGRFQQLAPRQQQLIIAAFSSYRIPKSFRQRLDIDFHHGQQLCELLGYRFIPSAFPIPQKQLQWLYWKDRLSRIRHGYFYQFWNYPGELAA